MKVPRKEQRPQPQDPQEKRLNRFREFLKNALQQLQTLYCKYRHGMSRQQVLALAGGRERSLLENLIKHLLKNGILEEFRRHGKAIYYRLTGKAPLPDTVALGLVTSVA